jgi:hypothetical protein
MMVAAAILACTLALTPGLDSPASSAPVDPIGSRVRALDPRTREWIRIGTAESPTFRALLARLTASDLILYIEIVDRILGGAAGRLYFVTATSSVRYVRIELVAAGNVRDMVALVGHELQHAVEIANAPQVRDAQALALLYLGMGDNALDRSHYDSVAARVAGDRVRSELAGYRAGPPAPAHPGAETQARQLERIERNYFVAGR